MQNGHFYVVCPVEARQCLNLLFNSGKMSKAVNAEQELRTTCVRLLLLKKNPRFLTYSRLMYFLQHWESFSAAIVSVTCSNISSSHLFLLMTWKNTSNLSNQRLMGSHGPETAETGLINTETTFVSADTASALLLPAEPLTGTLICWNPADHHDSPWVCPGRTAHRQAWIPLGKHKQRGCCSQAPVRKQTARLCLKCIWQREYTSGHATDGSFNACPAQEQWVAPTLSFLIYTCVWSETSFIRPKSNMGMQPGNAFGF